MFTERQQKILEVLWQHKDGLVSEEIARLCAVSSKTVRTDMKAIADQLDEEIATLENSKRQGYFLKIRDEQALDHLLHGKRVASGDGSTRTEQILRAVLLATLRGETVKQQSLADDLYVGLSTFKLDLRAVKEELEKYDISIVNFKNYGMALEGDERDIRRCMFDHLFCPPDARELVLEEMPCRIDIGELQSIAIRVTSSYDVMLMDDSLEHLLDYLLITLTRAEQEHNISYKLRESKEIESHSEFAMASAIFEEVYQAFGMDVLTSEIYYIAQHLIGSKKYTPSKSGTGEHAQLLADKMMERIWELTGLDFRKDETLRKGLKTHLESVIPRIRFRTRIQNEVLSVVKNEYPLAFQIGVIAGKVIEEAEKTPVSEDEIGFLAVHFGAALTRMNINTNLKKQTAYIVCGSGIGTAILLKARVEEYFRGLLSVEKVMPGYRLKSEQLDGIDLIISTIPQEKLPTLSEQDAKKVIVVRHFLDDKEIKTIQKKLLKATRFFAENVEKFFRPECFRIAPKRYDTKEQVLKFMTDELIAQGFMDEEAAASVLERENASPTEIGNLVAIPHPMANNATVSSISVLVLPRPMLWVEHQVQVVFLLSIAKAEFYLWEPIFLKLFKYLVKENGVRRILANPDYSEFIRALKQSFS
ncbi:MAG: transcription antiterminator [Selenomonadaceae bacterium]|nr:transcription antiterminator [Selenomonadaceae bacterium]